MYSCLPKIITELKQNFIEVENEIAYRTRVNSKQIKDRKLNFFFCHFIIDVAYLICFGAYEVFKIMKMSCNTLTLQQ